MKNDKEKNKDKKNKGRYLSPSFRKGAVKEKKEEDEGGFKINLIAAENDDDDEDTKSPSPNKHKKNKKKEEKESQILQQLKMIQKKKKNQNIEAPHIQFQMNVK
jgi:hypothetical protein